MSFRIPDETISEIRRTADIVEIVSEVVRLKKTGKNLIGLCPFHSEKTPSFTVNPDKQIFHCFGCQEGGNAFSFLMKHEGLSFPEAVRALGRRYGITVPNRVADGAPSGGKSEREQVLELNKLAGKYFQDALSNKIRGRAAAEYLNRRGISEEMIHRFSIGYAPEGWDNLLRFYKGKKISPGSLEKTGLIVSRKAGNGFYDRFRHRIMFPIGDMNGQIIGFGGRAIDESLPKYLNSPETLAYNKSRSLYGIQTAKKKCRESNEAYVVEGYLDCIALHQFGLENAVATLGTSLTHEHIRMLKGFSEKIILVFDSDDAGIKAAARSVGLFIQQDVKARIMILPEGHDPDSYLKSFGRTAFKALSETALGLIEFLVETAVKRHGMTAEGKIRVINDLIEPLASIDDMVARSLYVKELSERVDVTETALTAKVNEYLSASGKTVARRQAMGSERGLGGVPGDHRLAGDPVKSVRSEKRIISMMLQFPEVLPEIKKYPVLDYFQDELLKSIGMFILEHKGEGDMLVSDALTHLSNDQERRLIAELSIGEEDWDLKGCIKLIQQYLESVRNYIEKDLNDRIKSAEKNNDQELLLKLLGEKQKQAQYAEKQKMSLLGGK